MYKKETSSFCEEISIFEKNSDLFYFMCMRVFPACCLCSTGVHAALRGPGTGVVNGHELGSGGWELNLGSLQKRQVRLTTESYF